MKTSYPSTSLLAAALVLGGAGPVAAQSAPRDVEAPQVRSFDFTPQDVDVTSGPAQVTVTARITDATGVIAPSFAFDSDATTQRAVPVDGFRLISGTAQDGTWAASVTLPRAAATGTWTAEAAELADPLGNRAVPSLSGFPRVLLVSAGGSSTPTPVARPVVLDVTSSSGATVQLTAVGGRPGADVQLFVRRPGQAGFELVRTGRLDASSRTAFSLDLRDPGATELYAQLVGGTPGPVLTYLAPAPADAAPRVAAAPRRIVLGERATVQVTGAPGAAVELWAYSRPTTWYSLVRRGVLDATGRASFDVAPRGNTRLYARVAGRLTHTTTVDVAQTATLSISRVPGAYRFSGQVAPARAGVEVTLMRKPAVGPAVVASRARTDSAGRYRIDRRFGEAGTYGFYVDTRVTADNTEGRSRTYTLAVER